jgi:hypothetical protein
MTVPALISNARMDYLAANPLGRVLHAPLFGSPARRATAPDRDKRPRHPVVGDLDLRFETMELPADPVSRCCSTPPSPARRPNKR